MRLFPVPTRLSVCAFAALACTSLPVPAQEAADAPYPGWIAERFCAGWSDPVACRAGLHPDQLGDGGGEGEFPQLAVCDYDNPDDTRDYRAACFFTWRANAHALVTKIGVETGANLVITKVAVDGELGKAGEVRVNGETAAEVPSGAHGACYQIQATGELFCIYEPGAAPQATPGVPPAAAEPASAMPGQCRIARGERVLGTGLCSEAVLCAVPGGSAAAQCDFRYGWEIGLTTIVATTADLAVSLNGAAAEPVDWPAGAPKCVSDPEGGLVFCFDGRGN